MATDPTTIAFMAPMEDKGKGEGRGLERLAERAAVRGA